MPNGNGEPQSRRSFFPQVNIPIFCARGGIAVDQHSDWIIAIFAERDVFWEKDSITKLQTMVTLRLTLLY
jgi:hypothetical protein